jgi:biotin carboxylase
VADDQSALAAAEKLGFPKVPIMIKSAGGGGGMGIKGVTEAKTLEDIIAPFKEIQNYAKINYNLHDVYFERLIQNPRHIEVQILGDKHGNVISLGERDCSIQRRHQKLIEFSPADISRRLRKDMEEAAVSLAKSVGYVNAGTVEFLVEGEKFYFMEVNTRIQVEHRVTEMRYGIDIVEEQLRIAAGEKLRYKQGQLYPRGYSIECRINAEHPKKNFEPCPGKITRVKMPEVKNVRVDSHISPGYKIPHRYDSLIANVIAYGDSKKEALKTMSYYLRNMKIKGDGLKTTIPYHILRLRELK